MKAIAIVDKGFIDNWMQKDFALPITDDIVLTNESSYYALTAKMGMLIPFEKVKEDTTIICNYVTTNKNHEAVELTANVNAASLATSDYEFNAENLEHLTTELFNRPYGWGGSLENRDCSSMIRDFMATYQIWLPRDSKDQVFVGKQTELTGSAPEKIVTIKEKAVPFQTILRMKGHNMLYVGVDKKGIPLIFHAKWGLTTTYSNNQLGEYLNYYPIEGLHQTDDGTIKGRYVLGKSLISTVNLGENNNDITQP